MHDGISGAISGGVNAFKNAMDPFAQPPTSAAALGNAGGPPLPMVSQDERSSLADRTGITPPAAATPPAEQAPVQDPQHATPQPDPINNPYAIPPAIRAGIFKGESGGDYNTLYGHMERQGPFAGTKLTNMTLDQALQFNSPEGAYGQWAAKNGIAAAPLGAYQIVHRTGLLAKEGLGLRGDEQFTPALQEKMGGWIYHKQGTGAWAGYYGPGDPNAYAAAPSDSSLPFSPGETLHVPSSRGPGGSGRQSPNVAYGGGQNVTIPGSPEVAGNSYGVTGDGQDNTALAVDPNAAANQRAARMARMQRLAAMGGQGVGPQLPQTRAPMQDQNNPNYQAVKAAQNGGHLRALPTVNVMQGLAAVGKGYRDNAGSTYG